MSAWLRLVAGFMVLLLPAGAVAGDAATWFDQGVRYDLGDTTDAARMAFASFRRAADAGLPEAEFNVAVMLDSGRGVDRDIVQAAVWYARAAAHGNHRAAYNLGQLYETGEGVPHNGDLANAWFARSDLPAAREHLTARSRRARGTDSLSDPIPVWPRSGSTIDPGQNGIELVWTSMPQPEAVRFFVELRVIGDLGSREIFSSFSDVSSISTDKADQPGLYAWRVLAIEPRASQYVASDWLVFRIASSSTAALP